MQPDLPDDLDVSNPIDVLTFRTLRLQEQVMEMKDVAYASVVCSLVLVLAVYFVARKVEKCSVSLR